MAGLGEQLDRDLDKIRDAGLWRELREIESVQSTRITFGGREFIKQAYQKPNGVWNFLSTRTRFRKKRRILPPSGGKLHLFNDYCSSPQDTEWH